MAMTARQREWAERAQQRMAACPAHRYDRPRWMGIVGWRNWCACGHVFVPHEHALDDGCAQHPERNGHELVDLPASLSIRG